MSEAISIYGAAQNNLKNLNIDIPLNRITVITGPSGAGKSSLAMETIYAEGQRLYTETFSTYARQFLERLPTPKVDRIETIPPALSVTHQAQVRTGRVTVLDLVEGTFALQNLFARMGHRLCDTCGQSVPPKDTHDMVAELVQEYEGRQAVLAFRRPILDEAMLDGLIADLIAAGFSRGLDVAGGPLRLDELLEEKNHEARTESLAAGHVIVAADRIRLTGSNRDRITEAVETALAAGKALWVFLDGKWLGPLRQGRHCAQCDITYPQPTPYIFSADSPVGACPRCGGYGYILELDPDRAIPDQGLSLADGAVKPFQHKVFRDWQKDLLSACRAKGIDTHCPVRNFTPEELTYVLQGGPGWRGVSSLLDFLDEFRQDQRARIFASRYRRRRICPECLGARIGPEGRSWRIADKSLQDFVSMTAQEASSWLDDLECSDDAAESLRTDLLRRTEALGHLGLGHLTLSRLGLTLSGGELSRVHLARGLGTGMSGVLYVLEEPSTGLHPQDIAGLLDILRRLRDQGNTVVVTDHDPLLLRAADHVIELGPGGGNQGGQILFQGPPARMIGHPRSVTAPYLLPDANLLSQGLAPRKKPSSHQAIRSPSGPVLAARGITSNNIIDMDLEIPLGSFTIVTGLSGSGKSSLLSVIHEALRTSIETGTLPKKIIRSLTGREAIDHVVMADQSPPARSSRSNPATFTKAFDPIRKALAATPQARSLGLGPSWFSFNSTKGGACPHCKGLGVETVEMQFLPDQEMPCPVCNGSRYQALALEVTYEGLDITGILSLTVDQAMDFFSDIPAVGQRLGVLQRVGLGHLALGQRFTTLSAGEAQRLKLARLLQGNTEGAFLILDEPSMGLHPLDTDKILELFSDLTAQGATILAADHEMRLAAGADWVLELGPESGRRGGRLVAAGPPVHIATRKETATGRALAAFSNPPAPASATTDTRLSEPLMPMAAEKTPKYDAGAIVIRGASEHNLQDIEVRIPRGRMVCITGVSGSGKSTLAFDVIFSEGRRRYLESQEAYVRKFLRPMPRPHVEHLSGLPPTIAVSRKASSGGQRSTVGTMTEVSHYLRLLFAKFGTHVCPDCNVPTTGATEHRLYQRLRELANSGPILVLAPMLRARKGHHAPLIERLAKQGIETIRLDGRIRATRPRPKLARYRDHDLDAVVGILGPENSPQDLRDIADSALELGRGTILVLRHDQARRKDIEPLILSRKRTCPKCHRSFEEPDPLILSFNSPRGACPDCNGLGWTGGGKSHGDASPDVCPTCRGTRLRQEALAIQVSGHDIAEISQWTLADALHRIAAIPEQVETIRGNALAMNLLSDIQRRLDAARQLGLGYLTLDRPAPSLSTGESQRLRLAAQLGSQLSGAAYVLDEPTVGLHPADTDRLISALAALRNQGATVLVVEHEESVIRACEHILDMGPGAGTQGGRIIYNGPIQELTGVKDSTTGRELARRGRKSPDRNPWSRPGRPGRRRAGSHSLLTVKGARLHNLKNLDATFEMGALNMVTGVSGSGKSSLVLGVLGPAADAKIQGRPIPKSLADALTWDEPIGALRIVDQAPIGRTPRSTPATYVGLLDRLRKLFAVTPEARLRGLSPSHFSFNSPKGACPACRGQGKIKVAMRLLPDVLVPCETCGGQRYRPEILTVRFHGLNMAQVLALTVSEARDIFRRVASIHRILRFLDDLGLGYLTLGQPSPTLSGGEAQRIRLAAELHKPSSNALYLLDEPTTGLHMADVGKLAEALRRLAARGNTVVVVEHNLDLIAAADWVLDLGPGPGHAGGRIVAQGPPEQIARSDQATGRCLARWAGTIPEENPQGL